MIGLHIYFASFLLDLSFIVLKKPYEQQNKKVNEQKLGLSIDLQ